MIRNFTKIRQWAGEKLGSSHGTILPSDEFKDFQLETKLRHEDFDEMRHTVSAAIKHIPLKKNTRDDGHRRSLIGDFGESLVTHASMFPSDSVYWKMLITFGRGECRLSEAEGDFADTTKDNYMALLLEYDKKYKEYQSLCRKLVSRRLDYDAKYNRLQKAKKECPENEQSVQAAKVKYEETELDVVQSMIYLQETEVDHYDALQSLLESQMDFHGKAFDILQRVKNEWDYWTENCPRTGFSPISTTPSHFSNCEGRFHGDGRNKPILRRACYDYVQDLDDELTFHVNDIITVLHKVDVGWWLGELKDKSNKIQRGIFPVNYTEPYVDNDNDNDDDSNTERSSKELANVALDKIDNTTNKDMAIMESSKSERDQDYVIDNSSNNSETDDPVLKNHTSLKSNKSIPQRISSKSSSFVPPSISSQIPKHDHQSKRSSSSSSSSSSKKTVSETPIASSHIQQHGQDIMPITPDTLDRQKPSAAIPPSPSLSTTSNSYYRPLPPIPLNE